MAERLPNMHESCVQSPVLHKPGMVEGKSCPCRLDEMTQWVQCLLYPHADLSPYPSTHIKAMYVCVYVYTGSIHLDSPCREAEVV